MSLFLLLTRPPISFRTSNRRCYDGLREVARFFYLYRFGAKKTAASTRLHRNKSLNRVVQSRLAWRYNIFYHAILKFFAKFDKYHYFCGRECIQSWNLVSWLDSCSLIDFKILCFSCLCPEGYMGEYCQEKGEDIRLEDMVCEENRCMNNGRCLSMDGETSCACEWVWLDQAALESSFTLTFMSLFYHRSGSFLS